MEEKSFFASQLKALREKRGLTQQELADLVGMGRFGIAKLEQGVVSEPSWTTVQALAKALGTDCRAFMADAGPAKRARK